MHPSLQLSFHHYHCFFYHLSCDQTQNCKHISIQPRTLKLPHQVKKTLLFSISNPLSSFPLPPHTVISPSLQIFNLACQITVTLIKQLYTNFPLVEGQQLCKFIFYFSTFLTKCSFIYWYYKQNLCASYYIFKIFFYKCLVELHAVYYCKGEVKNRSFHWP